MRSVLVLPAIFLLITTSVFAQGPQSSLFQASPIYHNPAFTGSMALTRFSMSHRNQWISLGNFSAYSTQMASFDTYFEDAQVGVGANVVMDKQGNGFRSFESSVSGSYCHVLNTHDATRLHQLWVGGQVNYQNRRIDKDDLKFVYQYNSNGFDNSIPIISSQAGNDFYKDSQIKFSGGIIYATRASKNINKPTFIVGAALHNLAGLWKNTKKTFHVSHTIPLTHYSNEDENTIVFTAFYRRLLKNQQLDFGVNRVYHKFMFGAWYRGMPFFNNKGIIQSDAIYPVMGFQEKNFRVTLAYDIPISTLRSSGSFEISIGYVFDRGFSFKDHSSTGANPCDHFGYYWLF